MFCYIGRSVGLVLSLTMSGHDDWREFLQQVDKLAAVKQRAIAAVIGALVADAACMFVRVCVACMHVCVYVSKVMKITI